MDAVEGLVVTKSALHMDSVRIAAQHAHLTQGIPVVGCHWLIVESAGVPWAAHVLVLLKAAPTAAKMLPVC